MLNSELNRLEITAIDQGGDFTAINESYGFSVRPGSRRRKRAVLVEWSAQYLAFLALFTTIGTVAGAASLSGRGLDVFEIGIFVLGLSASIGFFWIGLRGTAYELQVDVKRRQLRIAVRNYRGHERIAEIHEFADVESLFVHRRSQNARNGDFTLRTQGEPNGVVVLSGHEKALSALHIIVSRVMAAPPKARRVNKSRAIFHRPAEFELAE